MRNAPKDSPCATKITWVSTRLLTQEHREEEGEHRETSQSIPFEEVVDIPEGYSQRFQVTREVPRKEIIVHHSNKSVEHLVQ